MKLNDLEYCKPLLYKAPRKVKAKVVEEAPKKVEKAKEAPKKSPEPKKVVAEPEPIEAVAEPEVE